jgi:hypothetical protein
LVPRAPVDFEILEIDCENLRIGIPLAQPNERSVREIRLILSHELSDGGQVGNRLDSRRFDADACLQPGNACCTTRPLFPRRQEHQSVGKRQAPIDRVMLTLDLLEFEFVAAASESVAHTPIVEQAFVLRARLVAPDA